MNFKYNSSRKNICLSLLTENFDEYIIKIDFKNDNEMHLNLIDFKYIPLVCYFLKDDLKCRLVNMICSDERVTGKGFTLRYVFSNVEENIFLIVFAKLEDRDNLRYPSIQSKIPSATYYEREIHDMFGLIPEGNFDTRSLVLHEQWPDNLFPLRKDFDLNTKVKSRLDGHYPFLKVEGEGVCEIPVGPVHAGIIEPGHFRFSIYGENIINLERRLYYTHKGIEKLAENMKIEEAVFLSERIAADETVANSMAYCQAIEKMASIQVSKKALQTRTLCAELERIWNHMGTIAGISTDVGFAYGAARANILKEKIMRLNEKISGSRFLFGINRIGGVKINISHDTLILINKEIEKVINDFELLVAVLQNTSSFMNRLINTGIIPRDTVVDLSGNGIIARSAGIDLDTRKDHPYAYYQSIYDESQKSNYKKIEYEVELNKRTGDVHSRFEIRVNEIKTSASIINQIIFDMKSGKDNGDGTGDKQVDVDISNNLKPYDDALGYAESHRGQTLHWVMVGKDTNHIFRYKIRTASFCNWPLMEIAVCNNIVPDFPLINKSFDLSYTGNDL